MPAYSAGFDCDDAALLMMDRLQEAGITAAPFPGNLKMTGEGYADSDHIWVLADVAGRQIALDRGVCWFDRQHYEGFLISRRQLLEFIAQDLEQLDGLPGNPAGR